MLAVVGSGVRCMVGTGWVYRVGIWEGYTGYYPAAKDVPVKRRPDQRSGPRKPKGLEWVGLAAAPSTSAPTLRARSAWAGLPGAPRAKAASGPITARFSYILLKVSQNDEVSPLFTEKACHSPCSQNGLQKSPLEKLRFPFWPAFSCKELMGLF